MKPYAPLPTLALTEANPSPARWERGWGEGAGTTCAQRAELPLAAAAALSLALSRMRERERLVAADASP